MKQTEIINTNNLPWDCRTLLITLQSIVSSIRIVDPGKYYHFGLVAGTIRHATSNLKEIKVMIGIDGLPIAKSSNSQLWPILAYIINTKKMFSPLVFTMVIPNRRIVMSFVMILFQKQRIGKTIVLKKYHLVLLFVIFLLKHLF